MKYLADFRETVQAQAFERAIDGFIDLVLSRLQATSGARTHLCDLWSEVREERTDAALAAGRKLEAILGFDPDGAPGDVMDEMHSLSERAGKAAIEEMAPVCAGPDPVRILKEIEAFSARPGVDARISPPSALMKQYSSTAVPWERGWNLARMARQAYGFNGDPLPDEQLAAVLELSPENLRSSLDGTPRAPLSLAIRNGSGDRVRLLLRKRNRPGLRFEAARLLAEQILTPKGECWLPATDSGTVRQKVQRAFAAEFLCPYEALLDFLKGDFSPESIEEAGEHFGVSELAIKNHLANHRQMDSDPMLI
ncbi:MAG: hypothetical protein IT167_27560 [Bryobacterales bacterium]|nr:hypothetical protein [Bryobacterales bacterium]